ncbi:uncharacterized protein LOC115213284 [Octopus sinensis]|uniref:Uncharacterized protein LOC115213284 n=1 Tax=Octopus sinensis TaxID=2607531 RepID=A0A6P7SI28_9MOLL|nr:uncharacterized protein LOC115213284 [Octopus sinensis]
MLKDGYLSYSKFLTDYFKSTDVPRSGRPTSATAESRADAVHVMFLEDGWSSTKVIAEILGISREGLNHIIHNILDMRKFSAKWVPKCLNADQKHIRMMTSKAILDRFAAEEADFMARSVTMDEIWFHHYDPQTKRQSMEWHHSDSPRTFGLGNSSFVKAFMLVLPVYPLSTCCYAQEVG